MNVTGLLQVKSKIKKIQNPRTKNQTFSFFDDLYNFGFWDLGFGSSCSYPYMRHY